MGGSWRSRCKKLTPCRCVQDSAAQPNTAWGGMAQCSFHARRSRAIWQMGMLACADGALNCWGFTEHAQPQFRLNAWLPLCQV